MPGFFGNTLQKLIEWIDWPPAKLAPGVAEIHWEFMGDLLGELGALSDTETAEFMNRDFSDEKSVRELTRHWIRPVYARFTPSSRKKVIDTLDFYLGSRHEKTDWIFPSYGIPIRTPSARFFFGIVREALAGSPPPDTADPTRYRENLRQAFANTLFSDMDAPGDENGRLPDWPRRKGLILPRDMERHAATQPLDALKRWATTGTAPDGTPGLPCDAARWIKSVDVDTIRHMGASRFAGRIKTRLVSYRITLTFTHPVGEGYLAHRPDTLVKTRKARCLIDRLGFLVRCYPMLRG